MRDASFQLHEEDDINNRKIYFDVIPFDIPETQSYILEEDSTEYILGEDGTPILEEDNVESGAIQGFEFVTFADLRGQDRTTSALVFSPENNNLEGPYYTLNHMEEENSIVVKGYGRGDSRPSSRVTDSQRSGMSRWNFCEGFQDASTEPDSTKLDDYAYSPLREGQPKEEISGVFLNVPGSEDTPRSLYGIDWDLGDLVPVQFAGKRFNVEVDIVYVAIDESGRETITGRNNIEGSNQ